MARRPAITPAKLLELGPEKLAQLVLDEAERDAAFRKRVSAALAARKGPASVAKIVDRRLGALERARSFVDWNKVHAFRDDLAATIATIAEELGKADPGMAIDRLLRFVATHDSVSGRVDDSHGRIENVYYQAIEEVGRLTQNLTQDEKALLPGKIMAALGDTDDGYLVAAAEAVIEHLPNDVLRTWDTELATLQEEQEAKIAKSKDRYILSNVWQYRDMRQIIADHLGDLDGLLALEIKKHPNRQDTIGIAERLLEAGRATEALDWIRRNRNGAPAAKTVRGRTGSPVSPFPMSSTETALEAKILEALENKDEAQSLRWQAFEATLSADILRDYVDALPDFEEFDVLDRAFAHALSADDIYGALVFFMEWPRPDLAARKVLAHRSDWNGGQYTVLSAVADALSSEHALAATILYRALADDILNRARSKAYPHAARYLQRLDALATASDAEAAGFEGIVSHANYTMDLRNKHSRKRNFGDRQNNTLRKFCSWDG